MLLARAAWRLRAETAPALLVSLGRERRRKALRRCPTMSVMWDKRDSSLTEMYLSNQVTGGDPSADYKLLISPFYRGPLSEHEPLGFQATFRGAEEFAPDLALLSDEAGGATYTVEWSQGQIEAPMNVDPRRGLLLAKQESRVPALEIGEVYQAAQSLSLSVSPMSPYGVLQSRAEFLSSRASARKWWRFE